MHDRNLVATGGQFDSEGLYLRKHFGCTNLLTVDRLTLVTAQITVTNLNNYAISPSQIQM